MCVCCRAGEAVGGQEEERYMGLVDDRKFYNQNLERLGLSVVFGFTPRELKGLREKERETEKGMGEEREVPALCLQEITHSFPHSSFVELAAGLMVKFPPQFAFCGEQWLRKWFATGF